MYRYDKQKQRGNKDWRSYIIMIATISSIVAVGTWEGWNIGSLWSLLAIAITIISIMIGIRMQKTITEINDEFTAANSLLIDLLKKKIVDQITLES